MPKLSSNQLQEYNDNSHVAPIKVLTKDQAYVIRKKLIPTCKKKNYPNSTRKGSF